MFRSKDGADKVTGRWSLVANPKDGCTDLPVDIPCGRCVFCRLKTAFGKTVRITHEAQCWDVASFLTLTYSPENLRYSIKGVPTLTRGQKSDMTLFLKRLRKYLDKLKVKYFQCAEYGETTFRPHHHVILYGFDFSHNREPISNTLFRSPDLDNLWRLGACAIGNVSWDSAAYVASYCVKKLTGPDAQATYDEAAILPPYMTSSLGLGLPWIQRWHDQVYPRDRIIVKGHSCKPPRYYDQWLEKTNPEMYYRVRKKRENVEFKEDYYLNAFAANIKKSKEIDFMKNPKI